MYLDRLPSLERYGWHLRSALSLISAQLYSEVPAYPVVLTGARQAHAMTEEQCSNPMKAPALGKAIHLGHVLCFQDLFSVT